MEILSLAAPETEILSYLLYYWDLMRNTDVLFNVNESLCHLLALFDASLRIHQVVTDWFVLWKADILVI